MIAFLLYIFLGFVAGGIAARTTNVNNIGIGIICLGGVTSFAVMVVYTLATFITGLFGQRFINMYEKPLEDIGNFLIKYFRENNNENYNTKRRVGN